MFRADDKSNITVPEIFRQEVNGFSIFRRQEIFQTLAVIDYTQRLHRFHIAVHNVLLWKPVDLEVDDQPFFQVQFVERKAFHSQAALDAKRAQVVVQIDDGIVSFFLQLPDQIAQVILQVKSLVDPGIVLNDGRKTLLRTIMHRRVLHLLLQAANHRRREHDVADGGKPKDEKLGQGLGG